MELAGPKTKAFFITLGKAVFFIYLIDPSNFHIINITPRSFKFSTLSLIWNFFWNSSNYHATKIAISLFGWNSPVHWAIPEKIKTGGVVDILFLEPLLKLLIFHFTFRNLRQRELAENNPWKFCKIVCHLWKISRSKTKTQWNFTLVFL